MLSDGSLYSFVKQLTMEYNMANKNITEIRQMFGIAQWLNRQGFELVHSQATTTSPTSYAVIYVNSKIAGSSPSLAVDAPKVVTTRKVKPQLPKMTKNPHTLHARSVLFSG